MVEWNQDQVAIGKELHLAIERGNVDIVRDLCGRHPWLVCQHTWHGRSWVCPAARKGNIEMVTELLKQGFDVNSLNGKERTTALVVAVTKCDEQMVGFLLSRGANPNLSRPLIAAIKTRDAEKQLRLVEVLVEHGAELNRQYTLYGDSEALFTALDWTTDPKVRDFLKQRGALTSKEMPDRNTNAGR